MKTITSSKYVKILFTFIFMLFSAAFTVAQEEEDEKAKFSFSGSVDGYYRTNLNVTDAEIELPSGETVSPQNPGTSFANETGFALGMANIIASYEGKKVGAVADIVFGPRGDDATGGYNLNQLYAYYNVSDKVTLTMGRFNTYLGYEVISPTGNFNYSTSYLFSSGPFSHVGLKGDFALGDKFSLMLAIMNVTDVNNNLTGAYSAGAQLVYADQFLNFYYDDGEALGFEIDYTGGFDISDSFFLGINAAYADNDGEGFSGVALYPQVAATESFSIGLRGEYFSQHSDSFDSTNVLGLTLTGSFAIENLTIKPEFRLDTWGDDIEPFVNSDFETSSELSSFLIAAIYSF